MADLTTLTDSDIRVLKQMLRWWRAQAPESAYVPNKPRNRMRGFYTADVTTAITAASWPTPGEGFAHMYSLNTDGDTITKWTSSAQKIYNFTTVEIAVGQKIAVEQDPMGAYWVIAGDCS